MSVKQSFSHEFIGDIHLNSRASSSETMSHIHAFYPPKTGQARIPRYYLTEIDLKKQQTFYDVVTGFPAK